MKHLGFWVLAAVATTTLAACGGANDGGLFGTGNPSGSDGGTDHPDASNAIDGGIDLPDGSTGLPDSGQPPKDAGNPPPKDAGNPPPKDSGSSTDPGVRCGDMSQATYCSVPQQICCRRDTGPAQTNTCTDANLGCTAGLAIPCDDQQDCADLGQGGVCCAQYDNQGVVTKIECVDPSNCQPQNQSVIVCNPLEADPCPNGGTCQPSSQTLPGYDICK